MVKQKSPYTRARKVFGLLFVLSTFFLLLFVLYTPLLPVTVHPTPEEPFPTPIPTEKLFPTPALSEPFGNFIVISMITSIISLFGVISSTILGWRREKRETKLAELEGKRQEIEIEKMRFELDKMKTTEEERRIKK